METAGNEVANNNASGSEDGVNKKNEQSEMSSLETAGNEVANNNASGSEDGVNKMNEQSEMSSLETGGNEPRKDGAGGSEDGTKKTDVDLAMSPLKNAEIKDTKDDGTSMKKNEVYPTSNLGVGGEFCAAPENMESTDTHPMMTVSERLWRTAVNHYVLYWMMII